MPNNLVPNRSRFPVVLPPKGSPFDSSLFNMATHAGLDVPAYKAYAIPVTLPVRSSSAQPSATLITTDRARSAPSSSASASSSASSSTPSSLGGTSNLDLILSRCLSKTVKADLENDRHVPLIFSPCPPPPQPKLFPSGPAVQLVTGRENVRSGTNGTLSSTARETRRSKAHKRKSGSLSPERDHSTVGPSGKASTNGNGSSLASLTVDESIWSTGDRKRRRRSADQSSFATLQPRTRPSKGLPSVPLPIIKFSSLAPVSSPATSNKKMRKSMSTAGIPRANFRPVTSSVKPMSPSIAIDSSSSNQLHQMPSLPTTPTSLVEPDTSSTTIDSGASTDHSHAPTLHIVTLNSNSSHLNKHRENFKTWVPSPLSNSLLPLPSSSPPAVNPSATSSSTNTSTSEPASLSRSPTSSEKTYKPVTGKPSLMTFHAMSQAASCPRVSEEYLTSSQSTIGSSALTA